MKKMLNGNFEGDYVESEEISSKRENK